MRASGGRGGRVVGRFMGSGSKDLLQEMGEAGYVMIEVHRRMYIQTKFGYYYETM